MVKMYYNKTVYAAIIVAGVILYILGLYVLFDVVKGFNNEFVPAINSLSSARISYKATNISITSRGGGIFLDATILLNITWEKKSNSRGPIIDLVYMNKTIERLVFANMSYDLINYPVKFTTPLTPKAIHERIIMVVHMNTSLISFSQTINLLNISTLGNYINLYIQDVKINRVNNTTKVSCLIYSNVRINAPVRITLRANDGVELFKETLMDYSSSPTIPYNCTITIENMEIIKQTKYIEFDAGGLPLERYNLNR